MTVLNRSYFRYYCCHFKGLFFPLCSICLLSWWSGLDAVASFITNLACLPLFGLRRGGNISVTLRSARETHSHLPLNTTSLTLTECQEHLTFLLACSLKSVSNDKESMTYYSYRNRKCALVSNTFFPNISWWLLLTCSFWSAQIFG